MSASKQSDDFAGDLANEADYARFHAWLDRDPEQETLTLLDRSLPGLCFRAIGNELHFSPLAHAYLNAGLTKQGIDVAQRERDFLRRN